MVCKVPEVSCVPCSAVADSQNRHPAETLTGLAPLRLVRLQMRSVPLVVWLSTPRRFLTVTWRDMARFRWLADVCSIEPESNGDRSQMLHCPATRRADTRAVSRRCA